MTEARYSAQLTQGPISRTPHTYGKQTITSGIASFAESYNPSPWDHVVRDAGRRVGGNRNGRQRGPHRRRSVYGGETTSRAIVRSGGSAYMLRLLPAGPPSRSSGVQLGP